MPVSALQPSVGPAPAAAPGTNGVPPAGFAAALQAATSRFDPTRLPTVSLGTMVSALADADADQVAQTIAAASVVELPPAPIGAGASPATPVGASPATPAVGGVAAARPVGNVAAADGSAGARVLAASERYLGVPYRWGGTSPNGLDCSGFVQRTFGDLGVKLPRVSVDQSKAGRPIASLAEARPGDLVFWYGEGNRPNHIGIYAGGNKMIHAPRTGDVVKYAEMTRGTPHAIRRVI
ncbi:C40 family peptidase [Egicoccus halophilus]|uniref:NlpC/P60 domain-containing protein n=1 Tax=Egicoccus halophilus TaxID=1670830 RepID=A0A8J3EU91_9ACTN|nr:C40 family peptidase [Egicoccus halophilus]GGI06669.1 hypothetical protein GCM10011354_20250 [Egicoccus halophilus]